MITRPLTSREIKEILDRDDEILRHQPSCNRCGSDQIQIMSKSEPARWRCRNCNNWFTSEPGAKTDHDRLEAELRADGLLNEVRMLVEKPGDK